MRWKTYRYSKYKYIRTELSEILDYLQDTQYGLVVTVPV